MFRNALVILKIYSTRDVNYRLSVLSVHLGSRRMHIPRGCNLFKCRKYLLTFPRVPPLIGDPPGMAEPIATAGRRRAWHGSHTSRERERERLRAHIRGTCRMKTRVSNNCQIHTHVDQPF